MNRPNDDLHKYIKKALKRNPSLKERFKRADTAWDIAFQIINLREKAGLTQSELAELVGTKQSNIARLESADYTSYTHKILEKIAKALNARVEVRVVPADSDQRVAIPHKIK